MLSSILSLLAILSFFSLWHVLSIWIFSFRFHHHYLSCSFFPLFLSFYFFFLSFFFSSFLILFELFDLSPSTKFHRGTNDQISLVSHASIQKVSVFLTLRYSTLKYIFFYNGSQWEDSKVHYLRLEVLSLQT